MDAKDLELGALYLDQQYGRDFVLEAVVTNAQHEHWVSLRKTSTLQLFTITEQQFLRDFKVKPAPLPDLE